jgi:hypothetical protein
MRTICTPCPTAVQRNPALNHQHPGAGGNVAALRTGVMAADELTTAIALMVRCPQRHLASAGPMIEPVTSTERNYQVM